MTSSPQMRLFDTVQTAALLGITPGTLKLWRCKKRGPKFVKLGASPEAGVAYDEVDVRAFIEKPQVQQHQPVQRRRPSQRRISSQAAHRRKSLT